MDKITMSPVQLIKLMDHQKITAVFKPGDKILLVVLF